MTIFELLRKTVDEMEIINAAVNDSHDMTPEEVLKSVFGEIEFDGLSDVTKTKLNDLVEMYLGHVRAALECELESKMLDIRQLKS